MTNDDVHCYPKKEHLTPALVWEHVQPLMSQSVQTEYLIFDETSSSVVRQCAHTVIKRVWRGQLRVCQAESPSVYARKVRNIGAYSLKRC